MERLVEIIGPAPSEDPSAFMERLRKERLRVGEELGRFAARPRGKTPKAPAGPTQKQKAAQLAAFEQLAKAQGLSLEEMLKAAQKGGAG